MRVSTSCTGCTVCYFLFFSSGLEIIFNFSKSIIFFSIKIYYFPTFQNLLIYFLKNLIKIKVAC